MEDFLKNQSERFRMQPKKETWGRIEERLNQKKRRRLIWIFSILLVGLASGITGYLVQPSSQLVTELPGEGLEQPLSQSLKQEPKGSDLKTTSGKTKGEDNRIFQSFQLQKSHTNRQQLNHGKIEQTPQQKPELPASDSSVEEVPQEEVLVVNGDQEETRRGKDGEPKIGTAVDSSLAIVPANRVDSIENPGKPFEDQSKPVLGCWKLHFSGGVGQTFYSSSLTQLPSAHLPIQSGGGNEPEPRVSADQPGIGSGFNLTLERDIKCNRFGIGIGVGYHRYQWSGRVGTKRKTVNSGNGQNFLVDSTVGIGGGISPTYIPIPDQTTAYTYGSDSLVRSYVNYLNIPIYLKWQPLNGRRLSLGVTGGVGININTGTRLTVFDTLVDSYLVGLTESEPVVLSLNASVRMGFALSPKITLALEPTIRQQVQPFFRRSSAVPFEPGVWFKGINLGATYQF